MDELRLHYRFLSWRRRIREIREVRAGRQERSRHILVDGDTLSYHGDSGEVGCYVAPRPLTRDNNYFEVSIVDSGVRGTIAVGLVPQSYSLDHQPGWLPDSVAYHADDGKLYSGRAKGRQFGTKCSSGDRIGCGIEPASFEVRTAQVFFTKNGERLLEYAGKGKSIVDVGLAQARRPLSPRSHYFEVEIVDPGEKCYIALGLARKDYPKNRHPGWSRGSVAYHADDGKIFHGSGVGDPFGPRCYKGDIMGCGIMFPRDYSLDSEGDSDDPSDTAEVRPKARGVRNVTYLHQEEEEEEEEEEDDGEDTEQEHGGRKVVVFFTRNGKIIGKKEAAVPRGGYFPTVGMLSSGEKVKVDLHPLSG
ncbi:SPRY domain-containing protein 3 isoform X3 [Anser cygnoides]|uniref:SPRY domain-containing protein 3 isoform X3 n=1 Tax=Anser cygnoides TaxID=8845 RepID=UPI0034D1529D